MRKFLLLLILLIVGVAILGVATGILDINQVREGRLPTVQGGQLPKFDVDTPEVEVGTVNKVIEVPNVEVRRAGEAPGS